jgi:hypothetical protein
LCRAGEEGVTWQEEERSEIQTQHARLEKQTRRTKKVAPGKRSGNIDEATGAYKLVNDDDRHVGLHPESITTDESVTVAQYP